MTWTLSTIHSDWTFHEPHLIHWIKYERFGIWINAFFNLDWLSCSSCLARPRISTLDHFWNGFDLDGFIWDLRHKLFNIFCKQLDQNKQFPPFEFSLAGIKISVWINSANRKNLGLIRIRFSSTKSSASELGLTQGYCLCFIWFSSLKVNCTCHFQNFHIIRFNF